MWDYLFAQIPTIPFKQRVSRKLIFKSGRSSSHLEDNMLHRDHNLHGWQDNLMWNNTATCYSSLPCGAACLAWRRSIAAKSL